MSTSKDGPKKVSTISKKSTSTKTTASKRENGTDRTITKKKEDPQKTKLISTALSSSLTATSEDGAKPKKSSISTKVPSKPEKVPSTNATKQAIKSEKVPSTTSRKVSSTTTPKTSTKTHSDLTKTSKVSSHEVLKTSSRSTLDNKKSASKSSNKDSSKREVPSTPSGSRITKTQYFPSKNLYSNALKATNVPEDILEESVNRKPKEETTLKKPEKVDKVKKARPSESQKPSLVDNSRSVRSETKTNVKEPILKYSEESVVRKPKEEIKEITTRKPEKVDKVKNTRPSGSQKTSLVDSSRRSVRSETTNVKEPILKYSSADTILKSVRSVETKIKYKVSREGSPDTSSMSERPRTATLRKGSIVNANIVGPEVPKHVKKVPIKESLSVKEKPSKTKQKSPSPSNSDENYDDDFESYDSDFEAYSSSENSSNLVKSSSKDTSSVGSSSEEILEKQDLSPIPLQTDVKPVSSTIIDDEKAHDSGTFELPEFKHRRILDNINESVKRENAILEEEKRKEKVNHSFLSDEGFDEQKSLQFINFADAKKKCEKRRASEVRRKRGEELLGMIRLDNVNFTIFDSPAVPYEVYITSYGHNNRVQTSAQTGDDDISEEVQTDPIEVQTRWTQMPVQFSSFDENQKNFWVNYKKEYLGAGDDNLAEDSPSNIEDVNKKRLGSFLNQSTDLVIEVMAEANIQNIDKLNKNERDIPFSDGYLQFNTSEDIFSNTRVQTISVFSKSINKILTVHLKSIDSDDFIKSIVSIWNISDFNVPATILVSYGEVCCSSFSLDFSEYIYAGQKDGAILVWNIKEKSKIYNILSRTPTFSTGIESSHFAKVVSIQPIQDNQEQKGFFETSENNEICSLDEDGDLIIWNLYTDPDSKQSVNDIVLLNTATISLQDVYPEMPDLLCSEFIISDKHIYISTNYGFILHYLISGNRGSVRKFVPATAIDATCLEACPFSPSFFLAGHSNGNITLYSRNTERPLMVLRNNEEIANTSVQIIQWSKTKPFVLYAKDSRNTIHIWDLNKSDMYPEYSISFKDSISCLRLSPIINVEQAETSYMLIGTEDGKIYLHLLNKEYGQESYEVYNDHVETFLNYVNRL